MQRFSIILVLVIAGFLVGCSGKASYHGTPMPDPKTFTGHFGDIDTSGDELVTWEEFEAHFPHATEQVFKAIDQNGDNRLDHDEWHRFKEAHGMKDHD